jgi:hypothetical protein
MTEQEWLKCRYAAKMLTHLGDKKSPRKQRLFAAACCQRIAHLVNDVPLKALDVAERYADNRASLDEVHDAAAAVGTTEWHRVASGAEQRLLEPFVWALWQEVGQAVQFTRKTCEHIQRERGIKTEMARQCNLIREIFGNPFRSVILQPAWGTSTVKQLAETIYGEKVFDRLPILADALEDAGCDNADILNHCRQPGEHVRGCWVVDLVLAKD